MTPYNTIQEGINHIPDYVPFENPDGGRLWLRGGAYTGSGNFPVTFDKAMKIASYLGDVNIGNRLYLKSSGTLVVRDGGTLAAH
jgi:hypothetical protein